MPMTMLQIKRSKKTTIRQFEIMLDFFENHPEMISGKLTGSFTARRREELWVELSNLLNSLNFGPQKTPKKWKKVSIVRKEISYIGKLIFKLLIRAILLQMPRY